MEACAREFFAYFELSLRTLSAKNTRNFDLYHQRCHCVYKLCSFKHRSPLKPPCAFTAEIVPPSALEWISAPIRQLIFEASPHPDTCNSASPWTFYINLTPLKTHELASLLSLFLFVFLSVVPTPSHDDLPKQTSMARLKSGLNFKDKRDIVGLTRCTFPAQRAPDGTPIRIRRRVEFASTMRCLKSAPGYKFLVAGRGVDNPDEVLVCTCKSSRDRFPEGFGMANQTAQTGSIRSHLELLCSLLVMPSISSH